ncbi:hypothetical protein T265_09731 [Opisthorchis viverrini]|uniref:Uncharacterized protein n=1 Tax=Opisthorchis viverrini TaxID=6198 RepID=A0A074Z4U1_OPIVI|nr:hypothetical protein T265_09731 [Opisthorchis viverrini]KER22078.1 hypothetical protein T265_09731 [Opisthorchis viverrini]
MTSVLNTNASLPYNHDLFESLIVKKRIKCEALKGSLRMFCLRLHCIPTASFLNHSQSRRDISTAFHRMARRLNLRLSGYPLCWANSGTFFVSSKGSTDCNESHMSLNNATKG